MQLTCPRCFKKREEAKSQPIPAVKICGGCAMDVDAVIGFLEFQGYSLQLVMILDESTGELIVTGEVPPHPPTSPTSPEDIVTKPETMLDAADPDKPPRRAP